MVRTKTAKAALISAAAVALTMIPLAGTSYAAGCNGAGCDNKGPQTNNCDDSVSTPRTVNSHSRVAQLRWSHDCVAAWVRVTNNADPSQYASYATIEKYNADGRLLKSLRVDTPSTGKTDWSNMLGGSQYYYRVCVRFDADLYPLKCSEKW
jgi:hypothetical protein